MGMAVPVSIMYNRGWDKSGSMVNLLSPGQWETLPQPDLTTHHQCGLEFLNRKMYHPARKTRRVVCDGAYP